MSEPNDSRGPISDALAWVARIVAISLVAFVPAIVGQWLDRRFGLVGLGIVGLVVGMVFGFASLLMLVKGPTSRGR